jgi:hypothetical protein
MECDEAKCRVEGGGGGRVGNKGKREMERQRGRQRYTVSVLHMKLEEEMDSLSE